MCCLTSSCKGGNLAVLNKYEILALKKGQSEHFTIKYQWLLVGTKRTNECLSSLTPLPLAVVTNRKQAEVGSPDDRGEVGGSQRALGLQEQQQTERKPPPPSQRQERPQR